jgi:hypothetical protein
MTSHGEVLKFVLQALKLVFSCLCPDVQMGHLGVKTLLLLQQELVVLLLLL